MFGMDFILGMRPLRFEAFRGTRVHTPTGVHKGKCKTGQYALSCYGNGKEYFHFEVMSGSVLLDTLPIIPSFHSSTLLLNRCIAKIKYMSFLVTYILYVFLMGNNEVYR